LVDAITHTPADGKLAIILRNLPAHVCQIAAPRIPGRTAAARSIQRKSLRVRSPSAYGSFD
jgi:hypothetical protein